MSSPPPLDGFTVLDLSSLGPASRCSRILADYGATVIKVGPVLAGADRTQSGYSLRDASVTDTDELLRGVGMTEREIEKMRGEGIVA